MIERLQKIISASGLMSRRAAEELIAAGKVTVNGSVALLGAKADSETDDIRVNGRRLPEKNNSVYIMLNKPAGYVTTMSDEQGRRTVADLISGLGMRLYPVGRLDLNSEGLLIMTNDGDLANSLMHPSGGIKKTYRIAVTPEREADSGGYSAASPGNTGRNAHSAVGRDIAEGSRKSSGDIKERIARLEAPIVIEGKKTTPASVSSVREEEKISMLSRLTASQRATAAVVDVTISEGRNRQVRRLCENAGLRVLRLIRVSEGPLSLGNLATGRYRRLTEEEVAALKAAFI